MYLLENVAGLMEHFLKISKELIQLLAATGHKVTKPRKNVKKKRKMKTNSPWHSAVLSADPLHL